MIILIRPHKIISFYVFGTRGGVLKDVDPWPPGRPRGHILNSLALVFPRLFPCPVLGSRIALLFESLKFCWKTPETTQKICENLILFPSVGDRLKKIFLKPFSP